MTQLLVFGAAGQVGRELLSAADAAGLFAIGLSRAEADITDVDATVEAIARHRPRLVVNAAAYTAVDRAESEPELARKCNCAGAGMLARACQAFGVPLVHLSTDFVFDGTNSAAYVETDPIGPLGVYARSKAGGEAAVRDAIATHVILRTSWVYGVYSQNFLKTILRLTAERDHLRVVADQRGCPTATADIAGAILAITKAIENDRPVWGTFHFAGTGATAWHGFANAIVAVQAEITGRRPTVEPIATAEWPTPAKRPANSELDSTKFAQAYEFRARPWLERTQEIVSRLLADMHAIEPAGHRGEWNEGDHPCWRDGHPFAPFNQRHIKNSFCWFTTSR